MSFTSSEKLDLICSKTCVKRPLSKRPKIGFQDQSLNVGQKHCRILQREHSAKLSTYIKLPFVIKIFVLSVFEWPFYTGFTVHVAPSLPYPSTRLYLRQFVLHKIRVQMCIL